MATLSTSQKELVVLGAGESGVGAALLAQAHGIPVFVSDGNSIKPKFRDELLAAAIPFEEGAHTLARIAAAAEVVKSPGLPHSSAPVQAALQASVPVISEIEFASRYNNGRVLAITGTNGKTTTTMMAYAMLREANLIVGLAGNIGSSWARELLRHPTCPNWVLEVSSFQLDDIRAFRPDVAILTNITPDHLNRYGYDIAAYAAAKFRIAMNQGPTDAFIYCDDDALTTRYLPENPTQATLFPFSIEHTLSRGAWLNQNDIVMNTSNENSTPESGDDFLMNRNDISVQGLHNVHNGMAASIGARLMGVRNRAIRDSLSNFDNVEHRLEFVATIQGVEFINDSKGTNVNATWFALESIKRPIIWIAGGVDKGNDYSALSGLVKERVKAIVSLGKDNQRLNDAFQRDVELLVPTQDMADAVRLAMQMAEKGDVVILSPACASFDLFEDYEHRGRAFKAAVKAL